MLARIILQFLPDREKLVEFLVLSESTELILTKNMCYLLV